MLVTTEELLAEISDHWYKGKDGNLYKLVDAFNSKVNEIEQANEQIEDSIEISNATGHVLDMHGADRQVPRTSNDDDFYRFIISLRSMLAKATGSFSNIKEITNHALQTNDRVHVWRTEPHHVMISLPSNAIATTENQHILADYLQALMALGNWLDGIQYETAGNTDIYVGIHGICSEIVSGSLT